MHFVHSPQIRPRTVLAALWRCPRLLPLAIVLVDYVGWQVSPPLIFAAVLDESAHVATTRLLLLALCRRPSQRFVVAALASSILIDIDHIPMQFGWDLLTRGVPRPYSHSLLPVLVAGCCGLALKDDWARIAKGISFGIVAHLTRDLATGGGVALLWPLTARTMLISYQPYVLLLVVCSGIVALRGGAEDTYSHQLSSFNATDDR